MTEPETTEKGPSIQDSPGISEDAGAGTQPSGEPPSQGMNPEGEESPDTHAEKRIRDLQSTADKLRARVQTQEEKAGLLEQQLQQLQTDLSEAVIRYREGILRQNPEIPAQLVTGSTLKEIDSSLENARSVVDTVKQSLQEQVPPGAPARSNSDVESLSARQKIEYGIQRREK